MIQDFERFVQRGYSGLRWTTARSISRPVSEQLCRLETAHVLAVFRQACNLVTAAGDVIAVVLPPVGDGPLNIVIEGKAGLFTPLDVGTVVRMEGTHLRIGDLGVELGCATPWEPHPDWNELRSRRADIAARLPLLHDLCQRCAPEDSLLTLLYEPSGDHPPSLLAARISSTARTAIHLLTMEKGKDDARLRASVEQLAGLGNGLTPAGDDLLVGGMIGLWLFHPTPERLGRTIVEVAVPRTTTLSAAFLRAAARGECSADWHRLLTALSHAPDRIAAAVQHLLAHGATSGADGLAGFLLSGSLCAAAAGRTSGTIPVAAAPPPTPRPSARPGPCESPASPSGESRPGPSCCARE
ncbi:MAG TPA: DUF2877 domain-containing protein [Chloroflexi bacterium]|nr:DUF2877 domain-containing protein [Chloroflexota bacterium]